jgi:hypothetical protein
MNLTAKRGIALLCLIAACRNPSFSQDLAGYRTGNYTGVNAVFSNPANIAGSRYKWDVNLFSLNVMIGNDKASYSLKDITHSLDGDSLKERIAGAKSGLTSAMLSMNMIGPSFMFNVGEKNAFAFTSRVRVMANTKHVDGKLLNQFISEDVGDPGLPYDFSTAGDNLISVNAWTEFGASYGRVIYDEGMHYLKGGITLKYLAGVTNSYLQMSNLKGTIDADAHGVYLSQTSGVLGLGFGGTRLDDVSDGHLGSLNSSGFGGDLGFVYEFRPTPNEYKLKAGIALLDIGAIRYRQDTSRTGAYTASITGGEKAYLNDFGEVDSYKEFFNSHPQYFTPVSSANGSTYSVGLPTTLQLNLDYHIYRGFYADLSTQLSLAGNKPYNSCYYNAYTLTPRWEGPTFGFYLPVNYNTLTHFNTGFCFRLGPLFLGSGSALSALVKDSKQADFYFGVRFGGLRKS